MRAGGPPGDCVGVREGRGGRGGDTVWGWRPRPGPGPALSQSGSQLAANNMKDQSDNSPSSPTTANTQGQVESALSPAILPAESSE